MDWGTIDVVDQEYGMGIAHGDGRNSHMLITQIQVIAQRLGRSFAASVKQESGIMTGIGIEQVAIGR